VSDQETPQSVAARLYRHCKRALGTDEPASYDCPHPGVDDVADALAAAEERGRRAGIEEAAKTDAGWRAWNECRQREEEAMRVLAKARYWFAARVLPVKDIGTALIAEIDRALGPDPVLAPRDSGKEPARMDAPGGPRCWCGRLSVSESGWCGGCESPTEPA
jgi:hypothetical protein